MPRSSFARPRRVKVTQTTMFDIPDREPKAVEQVAPSVFDFETHAVRTKGRDGETWFVAADVCRAIDHKGVGDAVARLYDDEKGLDTIDTLGGKQSVAVINESGLYHLLLTVRRKDGKEHPVVTRFKQWVTREVLPAIRKTGSYSPASARVVATQRRLNCTVETAAARVKQIDTNKSVHSDMADSKATRNDFKSLHNRTYIGQFGVNASGLRGWVDITNGTTPLDRMAEIPLTINTHAKLLASRYIKEHAVPLADQPAVFERFARQMAEADLLRLGHDFGFGVVDSARRGLVIDVVRRLPAPAA